MMKNSNGHVKFDVVIGNPPFQDESVGDATNQPPIYHKFLSQAYLVSNLVELIHPARFLFNAGETPKRWNRKMLNNEHLKVLMYQPNSNDVFPGTSITGGIAVTMYDKSKDFGAIKKFIPFDKLRSIVSKVNNQHFESITNIINVQSKFNLVALKASFPESKEIAGNDKRIRAYAFERYNFFQEAPFENSYKILGLINSKRQYRYISKKYVQDVDWLHEYKVFVPESNGASGMLTFNGAARIISKPELGIPNEGCTQTFIVFGPVKTKEEGMNLKKYILTKFTRVLLGSLKVTQRNNSKTWSNVPLQDFTSDSDIDWSKSIANIDQQLYKKYKLSKDEINFIEKHVKEMK